MHRPMLAKVLAPFALSVVVFAACLTPKELETTVQKVTIFAEAGEKCLLATYKAEQEACLVLPTNLQRTACVLEVRAKEFWQVVIAGIDAYHQFRCLQEPHKCPAPLPARSAESTSSNSVETPRRPAESPATPASEPSKTEP